LTAERLFALKVAVEDQFPHLTGARFVASLTAVFDLDFHEFVLATQNHQCTPLPEDYP
jgi:hypothetical protein